MEKLHVLIVGGGMISQEVIIPTCCQERRFGRVASVAVSALDGKITGKVKALFPKEDILYHPDPAKVPADKPFPDLFKTALDELAARSGPKAVVVATPDHLHTMVIREATKRGLDCVVEKPLCLKVSEVHEIEALAAPKALYVYTDFHKRHDPAVRAARYRYRKGDLGQLLHAHAWIEEKKEMPLSNFAAWAHDSSSFEYIGVHYADAYYFITGLKPVRVHGYGQRKWLHTKGSKAYDAVQAVVEWEDGSVYWIQTSWVLPQSNSSLTNQGFQMTGTKGEHKADHKDRHCYFVTDEGGFEHYNPLFYKGYNDWDDPEIVEWFGYGYWSIKQGLDDIARIHEATKGKSEAETLAVRRKMLADWAATRPLPNQALVGTAINEAVRLSFSNGNRGVVFDEKMNPRLAE